MAHKWLLEVSCMQWWKQKTKIEMDGEDYQDCIISLLDTNSFTCLYRSA